MLQTRNAKRPAAGGGALRRETPSTRGCSTKEEALATIDAGPLDALLHPTFDPKPSSRCSATGVSPRRAPPRARSCSPPTRPSQPPSRRRDVILVRPFTEADDVAGFYAAQGILTSEGGKACHAALVARGMARPAVVRRRALEIDLGAKTVARQRHDAVSAGDLIAIDGSTGAVTIDDVPLVARSLESTRTSSACSSGRTRSAGSACAPTPTPPRTPRGARVRRRGHRPVPHRAHVHGRGPPAQDARDDHGRRPRRSGAPRSPSCCRSSRRTSRGCSRRWPACR